jgi:glycosyltransferase involved in cell wall biosynthesis
LGASLASLWRQTWRDFEVIAVDDGSNDGSGDALEQEAARDRRLRVVHTPPRGLPLALNEGLAMARAPLVARQDADDVSHRTRFELQTEALRADRDIAIVGSRVRLFPSYQAGFGMRRWVAWHNTLLTHEQMKHERFIDIPLVHGTALLRRSWLERVGGWAERGWPEDLDLLLRLFEAGARFGKRPEILYGWRQHSGSATRRDPRYRRQRFVDLKLDALERGLLRGRETMTLVGVGDSVQRCESVFRKRRRVNVIQAGAPTPASLRGLVAPIILVFGSPHARARWREALVNLGLCEDDDFIFIA